MVMRLVEANLHNDIAKLNEVNLLMSELRGAWVAIDHSNVRLNVAAPPVPFQHDALAPRKMFFVEV